MAESTPDRLLMRVERLVMSIRKINEIIKGNPDHPMMDTFNRRVSDYQESIRNIQEYGSEKMPTAAKAGTKINVPADVLVTRSE